MSAVENSSGLSCTAGSSRHADDAPAVGRGAQQLGDVELGLAEELVPAAVLEPDQAAQQHAHGGSGQAADAVQLGLALRRSRGTSSSARRSERSSSGSPFSSA